MHEEKISGILAQVLGVNYVVKHSDEPITLGTLNRVLLKAEERFATTEFVNSVSSACEEHLNAFQSGLNGAEHKVIQMWNSMNAVVRAITNKGLIFEPDVVEAGRQLVAEANQFFQEVKKQQARKEVSGLVSASGAPIKETPVAAPKFPLDEVLGAINKASNMEAAFRKDKKEN